MNLRSERGFSLVELMIVVAIIGILAAIAIPNFTRFQTKSRQSEARANLAAIYAAEKAFTAEWQQFYTQFAEIGYVPEGDFNYEHGFGAAGPNSPQTYTGLIGANQPPTVFNTLGCAAPPAAATAPFRPGIFCRVNRAPAGGAVPTVVGAAPAPTAVTFIAVAHANLDGDAAIDRWSINESKQIFGPCAVAAPCTQAGQNGGDLDN